MDDLFNLSNRFERLQEIIVLREQRLKAIEEEVLHWFGSSNIDEIEKLIQKKESILFTNHKLRLFIVKWEKEHSDYLSEDPLYTSV